MKLVIAATPKVAIPTINFLKARHHLTIVTQPDSSAGRGKVLRQSEVAEAFEDVLKPETQEDLGNVLKGTDLLLTIGYGRILKKEILSIPKFGGINLHFSLLPKWRGAAPVQRAIEAGDKLSGVTVFQMDEGMDTGPIWTQLQYPIPDGFTSVDLFGALSNLGVEAVEQAIRAIESNSNPVAQEGIATIANKVSKAECIINWNSPSEEIVRKIRAFAFNPGTTTTIRGQRIKIYDAKVGSAKLKSGILGSNAEVGTLDGSVQIISLIPAGKRLMSATEWLNGFKPQPGERFE